MPDKLKNADEVLYRQIHPDLLDANVPASSNFKPKASDSNQLSLDRSSLSTPKGAFDLYVDNGKKSAAVFGLSVGEFRIENIECFEDPIPATPTTKANLAHAIADFSPHTKSQHEKIAKRLKQKAIQRGKLYP
jgi:hypothetical protein